MTAPATQGFRQSMAWLHTWSGLLFGWLLFVMFACGTCAYFNDEITRWMQPEVVPATDQGTAVDAAAQWLQKTQPTSTYWYITPPGKRAATTSLFWVLPEGAPRSETQAKLDGRGQPVTARETAGGFFLYRFHFDLHYMPVIWARYIVGIAAMFMLVAIFSGIVTHKKIFTDFFMLRFGKGQRSWLDAHNVTAVLALPFHLMITYTGLVTLDSLLAPAPISANYASEDSFFADAFPQTDGGTRAEKPAPLAPISAMIADARARWGDKEVGFITVANPGDAGATVTITSSPGASMNASGKSLQYDGVTGRVKGDEAARGPAQITHGVLIGLHAGRYADMPLRWLYFLSGVGGTVMVGSGLILWTVKRRSRLPDPARPHFGFRLVERLNLGVVIGFPAGLACYFLANRLLPLEMAGRREWEIHCLFIGWAAMSLWGVVRPTPRAWPELAGIAAFAFAAVPFVNALTTGRSLPVSLITGDWLFVAFDSIMLIAAAAFGWIAWKMANREAAPAPRKRRTPRVNAEASA